MWMTRLQNDTQTRAHMLSTGQQHRLFSLVIVSPSIQPVGPQRRVTPPSQTSGNDGHVDGAALVVDSSRSTKFCHEVNNTLAVDDADG